MKHTKSALGTHKSAVKESDRLRTSQPSLSLFPFFPFIPFDDFGLLVPLFSFFFSFLFFFKKIGSRLIDWNDGWVDET